jgi:membrane protein DedA with SNARE-associated domain
MSTPVVLPGFLGSLAPVLNNWGYLAVGGLLFLEDFGVPAPGETVLIAAAVYAGAGRLNIFMVGLVAVVAAIIGDNIGYAIGFFGGRALVLRFGKYVRLTPERLDKAEAFFARYGGVVVAGARFIEGLRQANGVIAGISRMPWPRFLVFNMLGAALWVGTWATVGYTAGSHITIIYDQVSKYSLWVLLALVALVVGLTVRRLMRRRARAEAQAQAEVEARVETRAETQPETQGGPDMATPADDRVLSFERDIKPMFRAKDREAMLRAFDLYDYDDVVENSDGILGALRAGQMPCDGAWPAEKVDELEAWIDGGMVA